MSGYYHSAPPYFCLKGIKTALKFAANLQIWNCGKQ